MRLVKYGLKKLKTEISSKPLSLKSHVGRAAPAVLLIFKYTSFDRLNKGERSKSRGLSLRIKVVRLVGNPLMLESLGLL